MNFLLPNRFICQEVPGAGLPEMKSDNSSDMGVEDSLNVADKRTKDASVEALELAGKVPLYKEEFTNALADLIKDEGFDFAGLFGRDRASREYFAEDITNLLIRTRMPLNNESMQKVITVMHDISGDSNNIAYDAWGETSIWEGGSINIKKDNQKLIDTIADKLRDMSK